MASACDRLFELGPRLEGFPHILEQGERVTESIGKQVYARWLDDYGNETGSFTFAQLWQRAGSVAFALRNTYNLEKGSRVVLCYTPGLEFIPAFMGCLRAGVVAVPVYPPNPSSMTASLRLLSTVIESVTPSLVIFSDDVALLRRADKLNLLSKTRSSWPDSVQWVTIDSARLNPTHVLTDSTIDSDDVAFVQFTSGSTAAPKGVMITYANLAHNFTIPLAHIQNRVALLPLEERPEFLQQVSWLPQYHDMGLVLNILTTFFSGIKQVFFSPISFVKSPVLWLHALSHYKAHFASCPNFAFPLTARKYREMLASPKKFKHISQKMQLDLSALLGIQCGAEPIRQESVQGFEVEFRPFGLRESWLIPTYGLAEHVVCVCGDSDFPPTWDGERVSVTNAEYARHATGVDIRVASPEAFRELPDGEPGIIFLQSRSAAKGYYNLPEKTAETFHVSLFDKDGQPLSGHYMCTNDLGYLKDGRIFVVGRQDDVIIINGRNVYAHDVEHFVSKTSDVIRPGCVAAFGIVGEGGSEELAVVFEVKKTAKVDETEICLLARRAVMDELGVTPFSIVLVAERSLPKTTSGKIQRNKTRERLLDGSLNPLFRHDIFSPTSSVRLSTTPLAHNATDFRPTESALPRKASRRRFSEARTNEVAGRVQACIQQLLDLDPHSIDLSLSLTELGMSSIQMGEFINMLEEELNIEIPQFVLIETNHSIAALIARLDSIVKGANKRDELLLGTPMRALAVPAIAQLGLLIYLCFVLMLPIAAACVVVAEVERSMGLKFALMAIPFSFVLATFGHMLSFILHKWIVIGKYGQRTADIRSAYYLRWWFVDRYLASINRCALVFLRGTSLYVWWLRALGADVGRNVTLRTTDISEFDLIHIADSAIIADDCKIRGMCAEDQMLFFDDVYVGLGSFIGGQSILLPRTNVPNCMYIAPVTALSGRKRLELKEHLRLSKPKHQPSQPLLLQLWLAISDLGLLLALMTCATWATLPAYYVFGRLLEAWDIIPYISFLDQYAVDFRDLNKGFLAAGIVGTFGPMGIPVVLAGLEVQQYAEIKDLATEHYVVKICVIFAVAFLVYGACLIASTAIVHRVVIKLVRHRPSEETTAQSRVRAATSQPRAALAEFTRAHQATQDARFISWVIFALVRARFAGLLSGTAGYCGWLELLGYRAHHTATIFSGASIIGPGRIKVSKKAIIQPGTSVVANIRNTGSAQTERMLGSHDVLIGEGVVVEPFVQIGPSAHIERGACVAPYSYVAHEHLRPDMKRIGPYNMTKASHKWDVDHVKSAPSIVFFGVFPFLSLALHLLILGLCVYTVVLFNQFYWHRYNLPDYAALLLSAASFLLLGCFYLVANWVLYLVAYAAWTNTSATSRGGLKSFYWMRCLVVKSFDDFFMHEFGHLLCGSVWYILMLNWFGAKIDRSCLLLSENISKFGRLTMMKGCIVNKDAVVSTMTFNPVAASVAKLTSTPTCVCVEQIIMAEGSVVGCGAIVPGGSELQGFSTVAAGTTVASEMVVPMLGVLEGTPPLLKSHPGDEPKLMSPSISASPSMALMDARLPEDILDQVRRAYRNVDRSKLVRSGHERQCIFLTGANGFLGRFLTVSLLQQSEACTVIAMVRAPNHDAARERMEHAFSEAFLALTPQQRSRLNVVAGNVAKPFFGMPEDQWHALCDDVDIVINSIGALGFHLGYSFFRIPNVLTVQKLIEFCTQGRVKEFHHVSSVAAFAPTGLGPTGKIPDDFACIGDISKLPASGLCDWSNGYGQSKWAADKNIADAVAAGMTAHVYRPGLIGGSIVTGFAPVNDTVSQLLLYAATTGIMPDDIGDTNVTAVEIVADALAFNVFDIQRTGFGIYNLLHPRYDVSIDILQEGLRNCGYTVRKVDFKKWRAKIRRELPPSHALWSPAGYATTEQFLNDHYFSSGTAQRFFDAVDFKYSTSASPPLQLVNTMIRYLRNINELRAPDNLTRTADRIEAMATAGLA